ncbi:MAG TPA: hypothetical protein DCM45_01985 [Clostridiales bacterium]|nr:hypothetical protein [Clostridiales bacterium]
MFDFLKNEQTIYWLIEISVIVVVLIFRRPLARLVLRIAFAGMRKKRPERYQLIKKSLLQPTALLILCGTALISTHFMNFPDKVSGLAGNILASLFIIAAVWMLYTAAGLVSATLLDSFRDRETAVNPTAAHFIASGIQILIVIIGLLVVLARWVTDLTGLIAGLGIGGLAIALAAQDTASNFIGSIVIMLDKPFEIGEYIEVDGIAGTVERVGLRSSRVRAVDRSLVYIPNAKLANYNIINGSNRTSRRVAFKVGLPRTATPESIQTFITKTREILADDPDVQDEGSMVILEGFTVYAFEIFICYYTGADYNEMMAIRNRINLALLDLADSLGVSSLLPPAYPEA